MATQPVVDPVKMPTVKADNKSIAAINAVSISLACFLGWMTIFAAIASFTKKWGFSIPLVGWIFGNNFSAFSGTVSITLLATGLLTVLFSVIGLITARKLTDVNAMKCSWKTIRNAFAIIAGVEIFKMIALAIYALCGLGKKAGVDQGDLWLNGFLTNTLAALGAAAIAFIAHMIAAGKTQVLSIMRFVALGIAGAALIITVIATFVGFYAKKSAVESLYDDSDSSSLYNSIYDLLK